MKTLQYYPHTADVRLRITADTLPELFEAGLMGMSRILKKDFCNQIRPMEVRKTIEITSPDCTSLMIDFLSEALTLSHIIPGVFCQLEVQELSPVHLKGVLLGFELSSFDDDIKAVTYHEAEVKQGPDGSWGTTIIFDI